MSRSLEISGMLAIAIFEPDASLLSSFFFFFLSSTSLLSIITHLTLFFDQLLLMCWYKHPFHNIKCNHQTIHANRKSLGRVVVAHPFTNHNLLHE